MREPKFEKILFQPNEEWVAIAGQHQFEMEVSRDVIAGYYVQRIWESEHTNHFLNAAQRAFGQCWYGKVHPTLVMSCEAMKRQMLRLMIRVEPMYYQSHLGFMWNSACWIDEESLEGTSWIVMLNEQRPTDPRFNGCYKFNMEGDSNASSLERTEEEGAKGQEGSL